MRRQVCDELQEGNRRRKENSGRRRGQSLANGYAPPEKRKRRRNATGLLGGRAFGVRLHQLQRHPSTAPVLPHRDVARYLLVTSRIRYCTGQQRRDPSPAVFAAPGLFAFRSGQRGAIEPLATES
ncbi:hypothetical protein HPB48_009547 [Haemaphysalis longicornis]|uniref:Uncharacterized protein n=1 Tax=Haemaphysalis longicornis TaxID=44386 RepID=A0A9J6GWP7_HAELO|nr:hypothetical protein HPB48_009547 [Haemaphysalis longicornis]